MKKRVTIKTSSIAIIVVALCLCAAMGKLLYVALAAEVDGINLKKFAENRNEKTKTLYASRGSIYDSTGETLALSVNSYTLIAYLSETRTTDPENPEHVVDKRATAKALAPILGYTEDECYAFLDKDGAYQVEFGTKGKGLTESTKKKIDDLELPGLDFIEGTQRYYKMGSFASYIIGYAKTNDDGEISGELGIESYFDKELAGVDGYRKYQSDAYGYQLPDKPYYEQKAQSGSDVYLTIDSNIQRIVENAVHDLADKFEMDFAVMAIMDAKTGAIVASATNPTYNPNDLNTIKSYMNPLVSYTYEPGSTMKIFSWASAIEDGFYDGEKKYHSGSIQVDDFKISDFNKVGWGDITFDHGFRFSSNVGATLLAQELGVAKLTDYYHKFGFGEPTGIELSGEASGEIDFTYGSELATAAFGQGRVTITPIQMLQALSALANDGVMLKPYIVDKIVDEDGDTIYSNSRSEVRRVMKETTVDKMRELLYGANYNGLTKWWQPSTVKLIGKTGTAQIASPSGGYLEGEYDQIYSFAGMFPDDEPEYIIYTAVKQIKARQQDVADMTKKVVDDIASYADISEEVETEYDKNIITVPNYKSEKVESIKTTLESQGLVPVIIGDGNYIINQYPKKGEKVVKGNRVFLLTNSTNYVLPDFKGWSLSDTQIYASFIDMKITYTGRGYVDSQSLEPGSIVTVDSRLNISLVPKEVPVINKPENNEDNKDSKE